MTWGGDKVARWRALVLATYGATCWLCGQPIDTRRRWPDPASLSLDHVRRRADGGHDSLDNLRPAHLRCNCGRRDTGCLERGRFF